MPWKTKKSKEISFLVFLGPVPDKWLFWDRSLLLRDRSQFFGTGPTETGSNVEFITRYYKIRYSGSKQSLKSSNRFGCAVIHQYCSRLEGHNTKLIPSLFLYQDLQEAEKFLFFVHSPILLWNCLVLSCLGSTVLMCSSAIFWMVFMMYSTWHSIMKIRLLWASTVFGPNTKKKFGK